MGKFKSDRDTNGDCQLFLRHPAFMSVKTAVLTNASVCLQYALSIVTRQ